MSISRWNTAATATSGIIRDFRHQPSQVRRPPRATVPGLPARRWAWKLGAPPTSLKSERVECLAGDESPMTGHPGRGMVKYLSKGLVQRSFYTKTSYLQPPVRSLDIYQ